MSFKQLLSIIKEKEIKFIDLRFTDLKGREHHITVLAHQINENFLKQGKVFDGSSISGWKDVDCSDMLLIPDMSTAIVKDPFYKKPTLIIRCDVFEPHCAQGYKRDPRYISKQAEKFLKSSGIADVAMFGPEPEFFVFDDIRFSNVMSGSQVEIDDIEAPWNNNKIYFNGNKGHRSNVKEGYFPVPPTDSSQDLRSTMCLIMEEMGLVVETHHHEVAAVGQNEITTHFNSLTKKADEIQFYKYVVHNVARNFGKTATFMPKPIFGDNGSGMHCHISLIQDGNNLFCGNEYNGLSKSALFYIGGIIKNAKAINAFTNPTTNSYRRLIPGYEAPIILAYSAYNRSASIRIPLTTDAKYQRIEIRFPDPSANPYLAFSALLMAGLDGIINNIHPGSAMEQNLYELSKKESRKLLTVSSSFEESLNELDSNREFLIRGEVFTNDMIDNYISLHREENNHIKMIPHPAEFELYFSV